VGRQAPLPGENEPGQPNFRLARLIFQRFLPFSRSNCVQHLSASLRDSIAHLKRYGYGSEPVCADGEGILTLEQLLTVLEQSQKALTASLQKISAEELAREVQSFLGTTTLGQLVFFLYSHETYHTGQTEALRQLAGKDDKA
jgi:uncharacterized damage-inducible protein DinB